MLPLCARVGVGYYVVIFAVVCKSPIIFLSLVVILNSLTACSTSPVAKNLEQSLAADSKLKENPTVFGTANQNQPPKQSTQGGVQLPADFPQEIPKYPNAELQEITPTNDSLGNTSLRWQSSDPSNFITSFYLGEFQKNNWNIVQRPTDETGGVLLARRNDLQLKVTIQPKTVVGNANAKPNQPQTATELLMEYTRNPSPTALGTATPNTPTPNTSPNSPTLSDVPQPGDPQFIGPVSPTKSATAPTQATSTPIPTTPNTTISTSPQQFSDINSAPPQLQQYIQDLAALGVLSVDNNTAKSNTAAPSNQFQAGKNITRREYARWIVSANNAMYANNPAKQIRLASSSSQPAFTDISSKDSDFPVIQGLAEAGLIPSPLSGDSTSVLFRPDAPLTREQLILWKVPLDTRQALPAANLEAVKQTWGFQDAGKIDPKALRAVLADHQNGEQANIRRVFGFTTLFQPKKPATRGEAAATLWFFGTQGEGISATEALKLKR
jgi:S-layer homology domain